MLKKRSFTLVELMVVILIIGILASLSFGGYSVYTRQRDRSKTQQALDSIKSGILNYYEKHKVWPMQTEGGKIYTVFENGYLINENNYLITRVLDKEQAAIVEAEFTKDGKYLLDRWGNRVRIRRSLQTYRAMFPKDKAKPAECTNVRNAGSFDLFSTGPDGEIGTRERDVEVDDIYPSDEQR